MSVQQLAHDTGRVMQIIAMSAIAALSIAMITITAGAALGLIPWLSLPLTFGETSLANAGMWVQILLTVLVASLLFVIPANSRIISLERSHRKFHIDMNDVARAYHAAHTADRAGLFTASSEFDQVRERLAYLRDHPDLGSLEGDILEIAAQMGQQARHLADVYSDEKVARAKTFLKERQAEAEQQQERIVEALHTCQEIRKWNQQVEVEESIVASQLSQLHDVLNSTLPHLGINTEQTDAPVDNVYQMTHKPAAE